MNALHALADPTRRRIVELLATAPGEELSAGELASHFQTSRPGVSRHLRVLRELGVVSARGEGTRQLYSLQPEPLAELDAWLGRYRGFWTNRLDALDTEIRRRRRTTTDTEGA